MVERFSIEEAFLVAWQRLRERLSFWVGIALIYLVSSMTITMVGAWVQDINFVLGTLIRLASYVVSALFGIGAVKLALGAYEGEKKEFKELYAHGDLVLPVILGHILWGLITAGGMILLIVPGVIWGIQFSFFFYYIIEEGMRPTEALRASSRLTRGAKGKLFGLYLLLFLVNLVGLLIFGLGLLVTYPLTILLHVYVYRKLREGAGVA